MENKDEILKKWHEQLAKEKLLAKEKNTTFRQPTLNIFLSSIIMQAMIALGKLENPLSAKQEKNPEQARFLIETLVLLQEKIKDNLTEEEKKFLDESLTSLILLYLREQEERRN